MTDFSPLIDDKLEDRLAAVFEFLDQDKDGVLQESDIDKAVIDPGLEADRAELVAILKAEFFTILGLRNIFKLRTGEGLIPSDMLATAKVLREKISTEPRGKQRLEKILPASARRQADPEGLARRAAIILESVRNMSESNFVLFGNNEDPLQSIKIDAIRQGNVGNCVFLAALGSVVSNFPQLIMQMISENEDGTYTVTFAGARSEPITVNRPTLVESVLYTCLTECGFWPAVIEKAFGIYMQARSFEPKLVPAENSSCPEYWSVVFNLLTGQQGHREDLKGKPESKLLDILDGAFQEKRAVTAWSIDSTLKATPRLGILTNHAYSVIKWDKQEQKITLRNPWGPVPGSEPETEDGEPLDGNLDGIFVIDLEDFRDCIDTIHYEEWSQFDNWEKEGGEGAGSNEVEDSGWLDKIGTLSLARICVGLVVVICGVCVSWIPFNCLMVASLSTHWPVCRGRISELERIVSSSDSSTGLTDRRILYTYEVNGKAYRSSVVGGMVDIMGGAEDQLIKENYPIGKIVDVHYNSRNPAQSCLRTGFQTWKTLVLIFWLLGGLLIALLGFVTAVSKNFFSDQKIDD